jgi:hypothetical protein
MSRPSYRVALWCLTAAYLAFAMAVDYHVVEFSANIWFFVPIGALFGMLFPIRRWWAAFLCGAAFSGSIEIGLLLSLPARYASWLDLEANSLGTLAGLTAVVVARMLWIIRNQPTRRRGENLGGPHNSGVDTGWALRTQHRGCADHHVHEAATAAATDSDVGPGERDVPP